MFDIEAVRDLLTENNVYQCKIRGSSSSRRILLRCPYCGDSKKDPLKCHLQISKKLWKGKDILVWRCVRCDNSGHVYKLLNELGIQFDDKEFRSKESAEMFDKLKDFKGPDIHSIRKTFEISEEQEIRRINRKSFNRIIRQKETNEFSRNILRYLVKERKYRPDYIKRVLQSGDMTFCDNVMVLGNKKFSPLMERVLFFSYNNILLQGRKIDKFGKRYYIYTDNGNEDVSDVIVFDEAGSVVFLVEGPFDALRVNSYGFPSISLQGKNIGNLVSSFRHFQKTRKFLSKFTKVIFCFDQDLPYEELERYCLELFKSGIVSNNQTIGYVKMYETKYKDIDMVQNEMDFETLLKTKVGFFSPLDRVGNIFKKFV